MAALAVLMGSAESWLGLVQAATTAAGFGGVVALSPGVGAPKSLGLLLR